MILCRLAKFASFLYPVTILLQSERPALGYNQFLVKKNAFLKLDFFQICSLLWSEDYKELASSHGSLNIENNDIILWKMNQFEFSPVARLSQHIARPLHMSLSPNKTTLGE